MPPLITTKPHSQTLLVLKGQSSPYLKCKTEGFPKPVVTWYKNGKKIIRKFGTTYGTPPSYGDPNSVRLIIVKFVDAGTYRCEATNVYGTTSIEYNVKIRGKSFHFTIVYMVE